MRSSAAPDAAAAGAVDDNVDGNAVVVAVVAAACTCAPAAEPPRNMVTVVLCFGERFVVDHENFEYIGDSQNGSESSNRCRANVAHVFDRRLQ